ncbi:MAG: helix-turn-helix domain-containing protein [Bacillota bacterium]|nr:helix-turn-helix domain-containing protein [Bacillota bacterium]
MIIGREKEEETFLDEAGRVYRALADPMRLRILRMLAGSEELGCAAIAGTLGFARATLSHHTRILAEAGLIDVRREGRYRYYRLRRERLERYAPALLGPAGQEEDTRGAE